MTRVLLDQGVPCSTITYLSDAGWDAVHTSEIGLSRATDSELIAYADTDSRVIVTLDADFHSIIAVSNARKPSVVRIRRRG